MSASQQVLLTARAGGGTAFSVPWAVWGDAPEGQPAGGSFILGSDGSIGAGVNGTNHTTAGSPAWFLPLTGGVGANYWARATVQSGTFTGGSAVGVWLPLSANVQWQRRSNTADAIATFTIDIATDAAGTNIVAHVPGNTLRSTHDF